MANTNVQADGNAEYELINKIMRILFDLYLDRNDNKKRELMLKLANLLGDGTKADYKIVPGKYAKEIEDKLQEEDIPYLCLPNNLGDGFMFIVADKHHYKERFLQIQRDVYVKHGEYFAQTTASYIVDMCDRNKESNVYKLSVENKDAEFIVEQKLASARIVCGKSKDGSIYIAPSSLFSKDGKDLVSAEIDYAITMAQARIGQGVMREIGGKKYNLGQIRLMQAECDRKNIDQFVDSFKKGKSVVLGCISEKSSLYLEAINGQLSVNRRDKDGKWVSEPLEISTDDPPEVIRAAIVQYTENIKDMSIVSRGKWEKYFKDYEEEFASERVNWIEEHSIAAPVYLENGQLDPNCNYAQGLTAEGNIPNVRVEFEGKQRSLHLKANSSVADICSVVEKLAARQVVVSNTNYEAKYNSKKENFIHLMDDILKGKIVEGMSEEEYNRIQTALKDDDVRNLLESTVENLADVDQDYETEVHVDKEKVNRKLKEKLLNEQMEKTADKGASKTEDKEMDDSE